MHNQFQIGIDLGGTKIEIAALNNQGEFESTGFNLKLNRGSDLSGTISVTFDNGYK